MIECYMCHAPTTDYGPDCFSCCASCSERIYLEAGLWHEKNLINPKGLGFEKDPRRNWKKLIDGIIDGILAANGLTRKKVKYITECPCGLLPSQCDYHR